MQAVSLELRPDREGGWVLRSTNGGMSPAHFTSRRDAEVEAAAYLVRDGGEGELLVFDAQGRVQEAKRWNSNSP
ncbi:MAG: DUF2188 domain-containing protein [Actinomycetota bacterium]|nr:DUF2188 domain-containing protein [Actinomycetota bacterium]